MKTGLVSGSTAPNANDVSGEVCVSGPQHLAKNDAGDASPQDPYSVRDTKPIFCDTRRSDAVHDIGALAFTTHSGRDA